MLLLLLLLLLYGVGASQSYVTGYGWTSRVRLPEGSKIYLSCTGDNKTRKWSGLFVHPNDRDQQRTQSVGDVPPAPRDSVIGTQLQLLVKLFQVSQNTALCQNGETQSKKHIKF